MSKRKLEIKLHDDQKNVTVVVEGVESYGQALDMILSGGNSLAREAGLDPVEFWKEVAVEMEKHLTDEAVKESVGQTLN